MTDYQSGDSYEDYISDKIEQDKQDARDLGQELEEDEALAK